MYTKELAEEVCRLLSEGMPLLKIEKMPGMPNYSTVMKWLWRDHPEKAEFNQMYAQARECQAERMAEEINEIADRSESDYLTNPITGEKRFDKEHVLRSRLRVDARKWTAAKLLPRKYGDRLELSGNANDPLVIKIVQFSEKPPE